MILSIITINLNNCAGLKATMQSVASQSSKDFEYIVIDGASTDGSLEIIYEFSDVFGERLRYISEPDSGIYNAINKGIKLASGEYIQVLNSGDVLNEPSTIAEMLNAIQEAGCPPIIYGNMIKVFPNGKEILDKSFEGRAITLFDMFSGTLNHDSALVDRSLFEKYGYYDEGLKICSDWEWFLKAIVFGNERPVYYDCNVTRFDMSGISERPEYKQLIQTERESILKDLLPAPILVDYRQYSSDIRMMRRIHRHKWAYSLVRFIERVLFKIEK